MIGSPVSSLYHMVHQVFAPLLLQCVLQSLFAADAFSDEKWAKTFDPLLRKLLGDLDAGLGNSLRHEKKKGLCKTFDSV